MDEWVGAFHTLDVSMIHLEGHNPKKVHFLPLYSSEWISTPKKP